MRCAVPKPGFIPFASNANLLGFVTTPDNKDPSYCCISLGATLQHFILPLFAPTTTLLLWVRSILFTCLQLTVRRRNNVGQERLVNTSRDSYVEERMKFSGPDWCIT